MKTIIVLGIFAFMCILGMIFSSPDDVIYVKGNIQITTEIEKDTSQLTVENLLIYVIKQDMAAPLIVTKQAILETGYFTSYSCTERNNLFGFRTKKGYLEFDTWQESVLYYKDMQCRRYNGEYYYYWLEKIGYAEDPLYIRKLKSIKL